MATEKWIAGAVASWTNIMSTNLDSLASGNALLQAADIDNSSALDMYMDVTLLLASITPTGSPFVGILLYPLNGDGSTYGDGRFASAAALTDATLPATYFRGTIPLVASAGIQKGTLEGITLRPGISRIVLWNKAGVNFAASGNTLKNRTYNRAIV